MLVFARVSGHEESAQADHFVPRCAIPRQCQKVRWFYTSIAKAASFSFPISAAFVAVFSQAALAFGFDLSVRLRLAASSRKRLQVLRTSELLTVSHALLLDETRRDDEALSFPLAAFNLRRTVCQFGNSGILPAFWCFGN